MSTDSILAAISAATVVGMLAEGLGVGIWISVGLMALASAGAWRVYVERSENKQMTATTANRTSSEARPKSTIRDPVMTQGNEETQPRCPLYDNLRAELRKSEQSLESVRQLMNSPTMSQKGIDECQSVINFLEPVVLSIRKMLRDSIHVCGRDLVVLDRGCMQANAVQSTHCWNSQDTSRFRRCLDSRPTA